MKATIAQVISRIVGQRLRCIETSNTLWRDKCEDSLAKIASNNLPSGAGIDSGTMIDLHRSTEDRIVLTFEYHFMNEGGYYDGWGDYTATIKPTFAGIDVDIRGRNRNDIKDYLFQGFDGALTDPAPEEYQYTYEKDPAPAFGAEIAELLGSCLLS